MSIWDGEIDEAELDMLKLRVQRTIGLKIERAVEKNIISAEEGKKLDKAIEKKIRKDNYEFWNNLKTNKAYEMALLLFENDPEELEILKKIEKA